MARTIRGRFTRGKIEPLVDAGLKEGDEVIITIREKRETSAARDALARTAGAWKGTLDFEEYLKDLHAARREPGRGVRL